MAVETGSVDRRLGRNRGLDRRPAGRAGLAENRHAFGAVGGCQPVPEAALEQQGRGEDHFWRWREAFAILFDVAVEHRGALATFEASFRAYRLPPFVLMRAAASSQRLRRSSTSVARSRIDHHLLRLHRNSGCVITTARGESVVPPGASSLVDLSLPVEMSCPAFDDVFVILPREILLPLVSRAEVLHGLVISPDTALGAMLGAHLDSVAGVADELLGSEAMPILTGTLGMIETVVGRFVEQIEAGIGSVPRALLIAIRREIEHELASPELDVETLRRRFNLSRATLYRVFASQGGVMGYIKERRLAQVLRDITAPQSAHRRIGEIAYDWGFPNEAAFSRAFRRSFGLSPREARQAVSQFEAPAAQRPMDKGGRVLSAWIRELAAGAEPLKLQPRRRAP